MLPVTIGPAKKAALAKILYIDLIPEDGRVISLQSYFDDNEKTFKQPVFKNNEIVLLKGEPECMHAETLGWKRVTLEALSKRGKKEGEYERAIFTGSQEPK